MNIQINKDFIPVSSFLGLAEIGRVEEHREVTSLGRLAAGQEIVFISRLESVMGRVKIKAIHACHISVLPEWMTAYCTCSESSMERIQPDTVLRGEGSVLCTLCAHQVAIIGGGCVWR